MRRRLVSWVASMNPRSSGTFRIWYRGDAGRCGWYSERNLQEHKCEHELTTIFPCIRCSSSHSLSSTAYFTSFGAEGPRKPLHGPNHGAQVFGLTLVAAIGSFGVFSLFRSAGESDRLDSEQFTLTPSPTTTPHHDQGVPGADDRVHEVAKSQPDRKCLRLASRRSPHEDIRPAPLTPDRCQFRRLQGQGYGPVIYSSCTWLGVLSRRRVDLEEGSALFQYYHSLIWKTNNLHHEGRGL